jgi:PAS domain S-box-containing protein
MATILLIENDDAVRTSLRVTLEAARYEVLEASDGETAQLIAARSAPDLIVQDLLLPDIDGLVLARRLHRFDAGGPPNIALAPAGTEIGGADLPGFVAWLEQPVPPVALVALARSCLQARRAQGATEERCRWLLEQTQASETKYRSILENVPGVVWATDVHGRLIFMGNNVRAICGFTPEEACAAGTDAWMERIHENDASEVREQFQNLIRRGTPLDVEYRFRTKDERWIWLHSQATVVRRPDGTREVDGFFSEVTERKRLQEQLGHAQKMEAIGQLTGGVAHDFNNLLTVIMSSADFLLEGLAANDPRRPDAEEVKLAADRAAALIRQLLAFSRKQVLLPTTLDLNGVVIGVEKMLRRLIGEDIEIRTIAAADLGTVRADVSQIEQVILNLAVNARDAMPEGGTLSLETANVELAEGEVPERFAMKPGRYVMLAVSDTGCGMDLATQRRIFEPFFTTKGREKGTGLGLSTSYGIVKQSGGYIWVYSEPGQGTVFKIYLPRVDGCVEWVARRPRSEDVRGTETILVVEDDAEVRGAAQRILESNGYTVLAACNGTQAVQMFERQPAIDMLLTDVVMPGPSGPELASRLKQRREDLKVLFVSGYADHAVMHNGLDQLGASFMQKPFAPDSLARKVREVLDA